jgi:hypothetical protein
MGGLRLVDAWGLILEGLGNGDAQPDLIISAPMVAAVSKSPASYAASPLAVSSAQISAVVRGPGRSCGGDEEQLAKPDATANKARTIPLTLVSLGAPGFL